MNETFIWGKYHQHPLGSTFRPPHSTPFDANKVVLRCCCCCFSDTLAGISLGLLNGQQIVFRSHSWYS